MRFRNHQMTRATHILVPLALLGAVVVLPSCKREARSFRVDPPNAQAIDAVSTSELHAGLAQMATTLPSSQPFINEYEENAHAMSEGKRLYESFNCVGCHFHGGGGIGPPLMDNQWIYRAEPQQIFATVIQGRPNGMPSFRGKIPDHQVWQIVAYVRSMSGLTNKLAAPNRSDEMKNATPSASTPTSLPFDAVSKPAGAP